MAYVSMLFLISGCLLKDFDPATWTPVYPELELSDNVLVFTSDQSVAPIAVMSNSDNISLMVQDSWINASIIDDSIYVKVMPNINVEQRSTQIAVSAKLGAESLTKHLSVVQMGGYWDIVGGMSAYWNHDVSDDQKEVLDNMINNMVYVRGGTVELGYRLNLNEEDGLILEVSKELAAKDYPVRTESLGDYYINKYEVTQKEWSAVMGTSPSYFKGEDLPVENISWYDAMDFIVKLQSLLKVSNYNFSLPTEEQWEYAAKGGEFSNGYLYAGSDDWTEVAHNAGYAQLDPSSPLYTTIKVGSKKPNELGLYDMTGNVEEMCLGFYNEYHVCRGGSYCYPVPALHCYFRSIVGGTWEEFQGFRIVLNICD